MPVDFLKEGRAAAYGRYVDEPTPAQLSRYFHLDDADLAVVRDRRGDHNKLGFGLQLVTVRFLGTFLVEPTSVPPDAVAHVAQQIGVADVSCLARYGERPPTVWEHAGEIQRRYGYRDLSAPTAFIPVVRWLYARAWSSAERPTALFELAVAHLMAHKILLPGVTILERLVARVRDRAAARLWRALSTRPSAEQRLALDRLLIPDDATDQTPLDRLRRGPTVASSVSLVAALKRLEEVRALDVGGLDLAAIPLGRLRALARHAGAVRAQAIARMAPDRRIATLLAFAQALEVSAQDDAIDVFDRVLDDLLHGATRQGKKERLRTIRDLDAAALVLRDACRIVRDLAVGDAAVRQRIEEAIGGIRVDLAIDAVGALTRPPDGQYHHELLEKYATIRRFLPRLLRTLAFEGTASARPVLEAVAFLAALDGPKPPDVVEAPLAAVPKAWRARVVGTPYDVDRKAYTVCIMQELQATLRRRDVYLERSRTWGDPRAKLLQGAAWEVARPQVCRALNHALDPAVELAVLGHELDAAYRRTAANLAANPAVRVERRNRRDEIVLGRPDRLEEPESLRRLRAAVDDRLPHLDLPELLLEVYGATGFADAFAHISEENARVEDLPTSLCAVLLAEACNIGMTAVAREDVPALAPDRLAWVRQNYIREETLARANARLVDYQARIPVVRQWEGGEVASVDGLRFVVPNTVRTIHAGPNPHYFGEERGATWLNASNAWGMGLHGVVVTGTLRDSGRILDLILEQQTSAQPVEIMSDTAGYSDIVFALFALLGYRFSPRLADIGALRFWRLDPQADYGALDGIARHRIKTDLIARHWDDLLRVAGSLQRGTVSASEVMRTLQSGGRHSTLGRAIAEYGRIAKSAYLLSYLDSSAYRQRVLRQLNRQESRHRLARVLFYGHKGELRQHYREGQEDQLSALGLVLNAVALSNTRYIDHAVETLRVEGMDVRPEDVARLSPLGFAHIGILGHYQFVVPASVRRGDLRPLRTPGATA